MLPKKNLSGTKIFKVSFTLDINSILNLHKILKKQSWLASLQMEICQIQEVVRKIIEDIQHKITNLIENSYTIIITINIK